MINCIIWLYGRLTFVVAAFVRGASGVVAFDLVRATLRRAVLRALVVKADLFAALGLRALALLALHVVGVVDQSVPVRTIVGVTVFLFWRFTKPQGAIRLRNVVSGKRMVAY